MTVEYPTVVKFFVNEDGDKIENPKWCMAHCFDGSPRSLCEGQCYGHGEGKISDFGKDYLEKTGKVTCKNCILHIKFFKQVKL